MQNSSRFMSAIYLLLVIITLSACSSTRNEPSDEFLEPIFDQTTDIVGDVHFGLQLSDSIHLNHYMQSGTPKTDAWTIVWNDLTLAMRAIVNYSIDLVDIADSTEGLEALEPAISILLELDSSLKMLPTAQPYLQEHDIRRAAFRYAH